MIDGRKCRRFVKSIVRRCCKICARCVFATYVPILRQLFVVCIILVKFKVVKYRKILASDAKPVSVRTWSDKTFTLVGTREIIKLANKRVKSGLCCNWCNMMVRDSISILGSAKYYFICYNLIQDRKCDVNYKLLWVFFHVCLI